MESIRKTLIDLSINKNMIQFLSLVQKECTFTINNIETLYTSNNITNDVNTNVGHSHTFLEIINRTKSVFENLQEAENYQQFETVNLNPYHTFKPVINRNVNYNNEQELFQAVKEEVKNIFLCYRQYMHYYSSIFYGSPISQYNVDEVYSINTDSTQTIESNYKGLLNFMSLNEKRNLYKGFALNLFLFQKLFFHFSHIYNSLTTKNENLNDVRQKHKELYISLERLTNQTELAKLELEKLLGEEIQEYLVRNPLRTQFFQNSIIDISTTLVDVQNKMNELLTCLDIDVIIEEDNIAPDAPDVTFLPDYSKVSVEIPENGSTFEYSLDSGEFFMTGSNFDPIFLLESNTTYLANQIQVRTRDNNHNVSTVVSNQNVITTSTS